MPPARLQTPTLHRIGASPLGRLFETRLFNAFSLRMLPVEFALRRAAAAAGVTVDWTLDDFLLELGYVDDLPPGMRQRLDAARQQFARAWRRHGAALQRWRDAFWNGGASSPDRLVALENERRTASEPCVSGLPMFGFLWRARFVPIVRFNVPSPEKAHADWADAIENPEPLYRAPSTVPPVETSARVPGPAGVEYLVRFPSPSPFTGDTAFARVYEPAGRQRRLPTVLYADGMGMQYDQRPYWPAEPCMGRLLAARGLRAILLETPWHGRRAPDGWYSGERYLSELPVTAFQLFSAQAQEVAVLIEWARSRGAPSVALTGMSLGAMLTHQVVGRCGSWPRAMRPDMAVLVAFSSPAHKLLTLSALGPILGVQRASMQAGWTEEKLAKLNPLLDPPGPAQISPDRIFAFLGSRDRVTPHPFAMECLTRWRVPERNVTTWNAGHIGVAVRLSRRSDVQDVIAQALMP